MITITNLGRSSFTLQLRAAHEGLEATTHAHTEAVAMPDGSSGTKIRTLELPPALMFGPRAKLGPFPDSLENDPAVQEKKRAKAIRVEAVFEHAPPAAPAPAPEAVPAAEDAPEVPEAPRRRPR